MSNHHTKGYKKKYVESYHKLHLNIAPLEQIRKHHDHQGYITATIHNPDIGGKFTIKMLLTKIQAGYGDRYYIECAKCGERVTYLMYRFTEVDGYPACVHACRHCLDVNYISQQATKTDTDYNILRVNQIGRKLDPDFIIDDFLSYPLCPLKPKYMKQVTYHKLRTEYNRHMDEIREKHNKMLGAAAESMGIELHN